MTMTISGSGTISGLSAGGLPAATVTQATLATPVAGTGPAFSASLTSNQSVSANVTTKVAFATEIFDTNNNFDNVTNYRFTPTVAGYYQFNANVYFVTAPAYYQIMFYKNGSQVNQPVYGYNNTTGVMVGGSALIYMNGSSDYVEVYATSFNANSFGAAPSTYFQGFMARSA